MAGKTPLRIGTVPYLNVEPLVWALDSQPQDVELIAATPRELAGLLAADAVDVGLVPVAEVLRSGAWSVVPGVSIACDGPIRSVLLLTKVPLRQIRSVLLDRSSMTSVMLGQLLLREVYGVSPAADLSDAPLRADHDFQNDPHDAFIIIGDEALRIDDLVARADERRAADNRREARTDGAPPPGGEAPPSVRALPHRVDLGEAWKALTGLPFVFAVWAVGERGKGRSEEIARTLTEAAVRGLHNLEAVCVSGAARHDLPIGLVTRYLTESIRYGLGPHEQRAMAEFGRRLVAKGLYSESHPLVFARPDSATATARDSASSK